MSPKSGAEVAFYGVVSTVWWISSCSVLLPFVFLLKYSKSFRDRWFSFIFTKVLGPLMDHKMIPMRRQAFDVLKEHLAQQRSRPLEVLEIGVGSGPNLQFYPENCHLTALDMNASFEAYFEENKQKHPHITYRGTVIAMAEDMDGIEGSSMDVVVCTYVLCSVVEIGKVLAEVRRVLKPQGKFLFMEHVAFPRSEWSYSVQRFVAPLWHLYFDGCMLDRDIASDIRAAGFSRVDLEDRFPPSINLFVRPQIVGVATK